MVWLLAGLVWLVFWVRGGWIAAVLGALGGAMLVEAAAAPGPTPLGWLVVIVLPWIPAVVRTSITHKVAA